MRVLLIKIGLDKIATESDEEVVRVLLIKSGLDKIATERENDKFVRRVGEWRDGEERRIRVGLRYFIHKTEQD